MASSSDVWCSSWGSHYPAHVRDVVSCWEQSGQQNHSPVPSKLQVQPNHLKANSYLATSTNNTHTRHSHNDGSVYPSYNFIPAIVIHCLALIAEIKHVLVQLFPFVSVYQNTLVVYSLSAAVLLLTAKHITQHYTNYISTQSLVLDIGLVTQSSSNRIFTSSSWAHCSGPSRLDWDKKRGRREDCINWAWHKKEKSMEISYSCMAYRSPLDEGWYTSQLEIRIGSEWVVGVFPPEWGDNRTVVVWAWERRT